MAYFDFGYFEKKIDRKKIFKKRSIISKIIASSEDEEYYDGDRKFGFGGYHYDGRWIKLLPKIIKKYSITEKSRVLEIGCKKGFFLNDLKILVPKIKFYGIEDHNYPIKKAMKSVKKNIQNCKYYNLPFKNKSIDFLFGFSCIYKYNLFDLVNTLKEIQRVSKKSLISVAAYETKKEKEVFEDWTLIGNILLHKNEWKTLFKKVGYKGDYYFTTAKSLGLT